MFMTWEPKNVKKKIVYINIITSCKTDLSLTKKKNVIKEPITYGIIWIFKKKYPGYWKKYLYIICKFSIDFNMYTFVKINKYNYI